MVERWRERDVLSYFDLNRRIHEAILEASGNATLEALYRGLAARVFSARYVAGMSEERWRTAVAEHEEILEALKERAPARLEVVMKRHLVTKLNTVRDWLTRESQSAEPRL
jgi:DNA-binding GntR family transcriptional regulator